MGTTSGGKEPVRGTSVAEEFQALQQLVGDWIIDEQVFLTPNAEPIMNTGRMTCRSTLGGLAMVVITEIATTGERTVQLITFNPRSERYEQALINSLSDVGIVNLTGRQLDTRSAEDIRIQFGKAATLVWEWTLENNQNLAGEPGLFIPERIVDNRINADLWVLQLFGRTAQAQHGGGQQAEFMIRQQVVTRASVGCQPQVGCELGCAGLVTCQEGCEGFQGPTTRALACSCESQATGQQQFVTQPVLTQPVFPQPLVAQQPVLTQPQVIAQQQLVTAMPLIGLMQAVAVAPQPCTRQVLRPVPLTRTPHGK